MADRTRKTWTHAAVADLVRRFHAGEPTSGPGETDKLIELGLIGKAPKPALSDADRASLDKMIAAVADAEEPARTLGIRYAIGKLRELLPKKAAAE